MSDWVHPMCDECWTGQFPGEEPVRVKSVGNSPLPSNERCCWCGRSTRSGIFVRAPRMEKCRHSKDGDL